MTVNPPVVAVACSGGRDSTALLHATLNAARREGWRVVALHVHHGLSACAEAWSAQVASQCRTWAEAGASLDFLSERLGGTPAAGDSVEAWARRGRYEALARMARSRGARVVLLGHHRRDQAETFLLQALRGGGTAGLSAMPAVADRDGLTWLRPWLHRSRHEIDAYVRRHNLEFVEDDSNADPRYARNRLRLQVWPALTAAFPDAEAALARAAAWAQEADAALSELADLDLQAIAGPDGLLMTRWLDLSPARRSLALRVWLKRLPGGVVDVSLTTRLLRELPSRRIGRWALRSGELRLYRGWLCLVPPPVPTTRPAESHLCIQCAGHYPLAGWGGVLTVQRVATGGVPLTGLARLELRARGGGERFQAGPGRPARSLKRQFQQSGVAGWARGGPLVYSEGRLVFVPGLGIDARVVSAPGEERMTLEWQPTRAVDALAAARIPPSPTRPPPLAASSMSLIVHKYGGTSMGSTERIRQVAKRVAKWVRAGHHLVVVPSAMSGETNRLLGLATELFPGPSTPETRRELDMIAATGEQVSSGLLAIALQAEGIASVSYAGWQVRITTDSAFTKARIEHIDGARVQADLAAGKVVVITGFQGVDPLGNITTLGRGGSDTSAVAVAAALGADECLIYTDVDGVYTTDPRIVAEARRLKTISFEEMLEMASLGSKVLQIRSVEFAGKYRVPLRVLSSFTPWDIPLDEEAKSGTLITFEEDEKMEQAVVSGIAFNRDEAKISLTGVTDKPGIASLILGPVADANIDVDVIIQNLAHDGRTDFSFTVHRNDYARTMDLLKTQVLPVTGATGLIGDAKICKVSIVGIGMRSHVGVASRMFRVLSEEGINIQMITTSEIKTSVVIDEKYMELAVRALHKAFDLEHPAA